MWIKIKMEKIRIIVPKLECVEIVLVYCNLVNDNYQQTSKALFFFLQNKIIGLLINVSPHSLTKLNTTNTEVSFIEVWFTDQNSEPWNWNWR